MASRAAPDQIERSRKVMTGPRDNKSRINTFDKMISVLGCFSTVNRHLSLAQVAKMADLPRPTTHRILTALKEIGFIEQDTRRGTYGLGIGLFELGSIALANMDIHREAKPFVDRLGRLTGETVHLGVFNGEHIVVIERDEPTGTRMANLLTAIETAPSYCTGVGKAVLAFQPADIVDRVVDAGLRPYTSNTIVDRKRLEQELVAIRQKGFAVDNAEHQIGVRCVAAPIRDLSGRVFAAISVTGRQDSITSERVPALAETVVQTADSISLQLGYRNIDSNLAASA
jgi:DNA-binding IclR family transcriptional regulator